MTLLDEVTRARDYFVRAGVAAADANADAEVLARHALAWDRAAWITRCRDAAPPGFRTRYARLVARRASREPVSLITGRREFHGLNFAVGPAVLTLVRAQHPKRGWRSDGFGRGFGREFGLGSARADLAWAGLVAIPGTGAGRAAVQWADAGSVAVHKANAGWSSVHRGGVGRSEAVNRRGAGWRIQHDRRPERIFEHSKRRDEPLPMRRERAEPFPRRNRRIVRTGGRFEQEMERHIIGGSQRPKGFPHGFAVGIARRSACQIGCHIRCRGGIRVDVLFGRRVGTRTDSRIFRRPFDIRARPSDFFLQ